MCKKHFSCAGAADVGGGEVGAGAGWQRRGSRDFEGHMKAIRGLLTSVDENLILFTQQDTFIDMKQTPLYNVLRDVTNRLEKSHTCRVPDEHWQEHMDLVAKLEQKRDALAHAKFLLGVYGGKPPGKEG